MYFKNKKKQQHSTHPPHTHTHTPKRIMHPPHLCLQLWMSFLLISLLAPTSVVRVTIPPPPTSFHPPPPPPPPPGQNVLSSTISLRPPPPTPHTHNVSPPPTHPSSVFLSFIFHFCAFVDCFFSSLFLLPCVKYLFCRAVLFFEYLFLLFFFFVLFQFERSASFLYHSSRFSVKKI